MSPVFRHGRLRLYLLKLLDEAPRHGYEVIRLLQDRFMGVYAPSPGTIYPRLARLEEEGLVTHDEADGRKVYRITEKGREELRARLDDLAELEDEITASVRDIAREVTEDVRETVRTLREELTWAAREFNRAHQPSGGADPGGDLRHAQTDEARARAEAARYREAQAKAAAQAEEADQAPEGAAQARDGAAQARADAGAEDVPRDREDVPGGPGDVPGDEAPRGGERGGERAGPDAWRNAEDEWRDWHERWHSEAGPGRVATGRAVTGAGAAAGGAAARSGASGPAGPAGAAGRERLTTGPTPRPTVTWSAWPSSSAGTCVPRPGTPRRSARTHCATCAASWTRPSTGSGPKSSRARLPRIRVSLIADQPRSHYLGAG
jgi:DNA-binding PadR family transcriptional regulator